MMDKERLQQETKISKGFLETVQRRVDLLTKTSDTSSFQISDGERKAIMAANNFGLMEGVIVGAVSLVALRKLRSTFYRRIAYQSNAPQPSPLLNAIGWGIDGTVSFFIAASASFYLTDTAKILKLVSTIPLQEGRSTIAKEFCPDLIERFQNLSAQEQEITTHAQTPHLMSIRDFIQNCQYRSAYEKRLRREKGVSEDYPVAIPAGGVPRDESLLSGSSDDEQGFYDPSSAWSEETEIDMDKPQ